MIGMRVAKNSLQEMMSLMERSRHHDALAEQEPACLDRPAFMLLRLSALGPNGEHMQRAGENHQPVRIQLLLEILTSSDRGRQHLLNP